MAFSKILTQIVGVEGKHADHHHVQLTEIHLLIQTWIVIQIALILKKLI